MSGHSKLLIIFIGIALLGYATWLVQRSSTESPENNAEYQHINSDLTGEESEEMKEGFQHNQEQNKKVYEPRVFRKYDRNEFQAGMNLLVYGHPNLSYAQRVLKHLRTLGINSVAITFPLYQDDWQANEVTTNPVETPSLHELTSLIKYAHAEQLSVMLRPILDEKSIMSSGHWRGQIKPTNPDKWFLSYQSVMKTYAELAESQYVDVLNIGTELNSMQHRYSEEWVNLIGELRNEYKGELIYSFNWDTIQHISSIEFVPLLDHIGIDAYFPLNAPDKAGIKDLEQAWKQWKDIWESLPVQQSIIITEAGMIPVEGAHRQPYAWSIPNGKLNWQAQSNYYEATFNELQPLSQGIYWWAVTLEEDFNGVDYSPLHSPTERVIKRQLLKSISND
ncbi:hypothetical protein [Virgibacillus sp. SK37]|uniref:glycoside hydrolase family 113 n=1 Tax=Virgibacillus sp. SK37 TaxID=403957 RepID=UPI0004D1D1CD|nr:hypothetical protein [Virgibacillus sp. SK37]AIF45540.1 hypothetical protein X953_16150 [Virgibacillus sp. SK37]